MSVTTLIQVHESKRGAADLLRRAAAVLESEGVDLSAIRDALCEVSAAKMALQGCERVMESMSQGRALDVRMLQAEGRAG